ncbi:MAG: Tex-like N-terminal domain-containing protein [Oligoflexales bacterium]
MSELIHKVAQELGLNEGHVAGTCRLLFDEDCTIPFVARYRKEMTGAMDEVNIRLVRDRYKQLQELESTRTRYIKVVEEHCQNNPQFKGKFQSLKARFMACTTRQELDDLYLPFKPKRTTKASKAREAGLEPLLDAILESQFKIDDLDTYAQTFLKENTCEGIKDAAAAIAGAKDILAERINETADHRALIRKISFETGQMTSQEIETKEDELDKKKKSQKEKYQDYFKFEESITAIPSHRVMAIRRGETEKFLRVSIQVNTERCTEDLFSAVSKSLNSTQPTESCKNWLHSVVADAYKRLMAPSIETELRLQLKKRSEEEAIQVFSTNLENLLLLPPLPKKVVLGVDPGIRTGSKLAVVSETGKLLDHTTIYPTPNQHQSAKSQEAAKSLLRLVKKHNVCCMAIGNGTGSREIDQFIIQTLREQGIQNMDRLIVNEAGASVYSTDEVAREEFPDLDPTIRSAISIARRAQDPLAELVKIDPRAIGVGQYQHDCSVSKLNNTLSETVASCVNRVGVDLNTASSKLLSHVSGIGPSLAKGIVQYRDQQAFQSRSQLQEIGGLGDKVFLQAAGFLRVAESKNPLDNTAVHPERYGIVENVAKDLNLSLEELISNRTVIQSISWEKYVTDEVGLPTLLDISKELLQPGRDPRSEGSRLLFSGDVAMIEDLTEGMKLKGTVSNVTKFGAFVDIGVHQDGLIHISELSDTFIDDPAKAVSVGDVVEVRVIGVDIKRKRISLSKKRPKPGMQSGATHDRTPREPQTIQRGQSRPVSRGASAERRPRPSHQQSKSRRPIERKSFTVEDLVAKFSSKP